MADNNLHGTKLSSSNSYNTYRLLRSCIFEVSMMQRNDNFK